MRIHFYSHTPHGVQPGVASTKQQGSNFYSHTPHGVQHDIFEVELPDEFISTHTPLTGCNIRHCKQQCYIYYFYSHTPHGVQHATAAQIFQKTIFLLTHPSRGATPYALT